MWLWHGTYEIFYKYIKSCGELRVNNENQDNLTKLLDNVVNSAAKKQIRGNCIYLSNDIECMDAFDKSFRISTKNLDTSKLFVANNRLLNYIIGNMEVNKDLCNKYIAEYLKSYINFEQYIKIRERYDKIYHPEFLYYGNIKIK